MDLTDEDRELILAALFSLWLTRSTFEVDPDADQMQFAHIQRDAIVALVVKLGGEPDTALFGAYRHELPGSDSAPIPDYPADETNEG